MVCHLIVVSFLQLEKMIACMQEKEEVVTIFIDSATKANYIVEGMERGFGVRSEISLHPGNNKCLSY
jgi:hypothetical protein